MSGLVVTITLGLVVTLLQPTPPATTNPDSIIFCYYGPAALFLFLSELMLDEFICLLACAIKAEHLRHML